MLLFVILYIILLAVVVTGIIFAVKLSVFLASAATVYSRIAFALLLAIAFQTTTIIPNNGWLNYFLWAAIVLSVVMLLSLLPRTDCAIKFLCTIVISYVAAGLLFFFLTTLLSAFAGINIEHTLLVEIVIKAACLLVSFGSLIQRKEDIEEKFGKFSNVIVVNVDRLISSAVYSLSIVFFVSTTTNNLWVISVPVQWVIMIIVFVGMFLLDMFKFSKAQD